MEVTDKNWDDLTLRQKALLKPHQLKVFIEETRQEALEAFHDVMNEDDFLDEDDIEVEEDEAANEAEEFLMEDYRDAVKAYHKQQEEKKAKKSK